MVCSPHLPVLQRIAAPPSYYSSNTANFTYNQGITEIKPEETPAALYDLGISLTTSTNLPSLLYDTNSNQNQKEITSNNPLENIADQTTSTPYITILEDVTNQTAPTPYNPQSIEDNTSTYTEVRDKTIVLTGKYELGSTLMYTPKTNQSEQRDKLSSLIEDELDELDRLDQIENKTEDMELLHHQNVHH